jgi:hypothetical protein
MMVRARATTVSFGVFLCVSASQLRVAAWLSILSFRHPAISVNNCDGGRSHITCDVSLSVALSSRLEAA